MSGSENRLLLVLTSMPDEGKAMELARILVTERLAACIQVSPALSSTYIWKGVLETVHEVTLHCKTTPGRLEALTSRLKALHPYETPEIVTVVADQCDPAYLAWVRENTAASVSG